MKLIDKLKKSLSRREKTPQECFDLGKNIQSLWVTISNACGTSNLYLNLLHYEKQLSSKTLNDISSFLSVKPNFQTVYESTKKLIAENSKYFAPEKASFDREWEPFEKAYNTLLEQYQERTGMALEVSPIGEN